MKLEYEDFTSEELDSMDPIRRQLLFESKIQHCLDQNGAGCVRDEDVCSNCGGFGFSRQPFKREASQW